MKRLSQESREAARVKIYNEHPRVAAFPDDYQKLTTITSYNGKDIKFRRSAESRDTALGYARRRNLILGPDEDVDGDQINDVVLYDYSGKPVVVNGYELVPSERPYREKYRELYPSKQDRVTVGGYTGFKRNFYGIEGMPQFMSQLNAKYPRIPEPKPKRQSFPSLYDMFCAQVREPLIKTFNEIFEPRGHMKSTFSVFSILPLIYLDTIIGPLWIHESLAAVKEEICAKTPFDQDILRNNMRYDLFKRYIKKNINIVKPIVDTLIPNAIQRAISMTKGDPLPIMLRPVLDGLSGAPTDMELAALKIAKDYETLNHVKIMKAQLTEFMTTHLTALKSQIINTIFGGLEQPDLPDDDINSPYALRVRSYIEALLGLDPTARAQQIIHLLRDPVHTRHIMSFMNAVKDEKYLPVYQQINEMLTRTGWLV